MHLNKFRIQQQTHTHIAISNVYIQAHDFYMRSICALVNVKSVRQRA